jgi:NAD(P)-dependent dehydrogenase (short-subunit alcohol dehydrogenase family)
MLQGKVVIVTGGFGALGRVVATEAAKAGAKVAVLDFAPNAPDGLQASLGADSLLIGGVDLSKEASAKDAAEKVKAKFGGIDAVFNIAGGFSWETVEGGSLATWDKLYTLNVVTTRNMIVAALPSLLASKAGRVVNVGANGAMKAATGMGAYAASKSGVHKLTESLAEEFKGKITVNAVLPSMIDTPVNRADMPDADFSKWVSPAQIASLMIYLASEEAGAVTGALIPIVGGL